MNGVTLMVSMADVGVLTGLKDVLRRRAAPCGPTPSTRKMYITGGVGTTGNEGFGEPYSLPNISAYAETCAVLMFITLNHRLFLATGDSKYIDVMERGMYNNALSGVSAAGDRFFYVNRLASAGDGRDERWERASLECCPPNLVRFLASMPGYVYAQGPAGAIYVNLYVSSETTFAVSGQRLALSVQSEMPWGGTSTITVVDRRRCQGRDQAADSRAGRGNQRRAGRALYRTPTSARRQATVVRQRQAALPRRPTSSGYVSLDRVWKNGDVIDVDFPIVAATGRRRRAREGDRAAGSPSSGGRSCTAPSGPIVGRRRSALDLLVDPDADTDDVASIGDLFGGVTVDSDARRAASTNPSRAGRRRSRSIPVLPLGESRRAAR